MIEEIRRDVKAYLTCLKSDEFLASVKRNPLYLAPIYSNHQRVSESFRRRPYKERREKSRLTYQFENETAIFTFIGL